MDIYRQEILDHYKHPHNFGDLSGKTHQAKTVNAACGDMVEINLKIEKGIVSDASFRGVGCALSTAAASLLTDRIKGKTVAEVEKLDDTVVEEMVGEINPGRMKCVVLPLRALKQALINQR